MLLRVNAEQHFLFTRVTNHYKGNHIADKVSEPRIGGTNFVE